MLDFLCIGAHKAGSTWLHANLTKHPDVWLPPFKELHFFDHYKDKNFTLTQYHRRVVWLKNYTDEVLQDLSTHSDISEVNFSKLEWACKYATVSPEDRTLEWYVSLFDNKYTNGKLAGEITPAYAILDKNIYNMIKSINEDLKIIFMMRNPIERTWSAFRFDRLTKKHLHLKQNLLKEYKWGEFYRYANKNSTIKRNDYSNTIELIESVFDKKNIHYIFFDDLETDPSSVIESVCRFLDIRYDNDMFSELDKKQLVSKRMSMPGKVEAYLRDQYHKDILRLNEKINVPKKWLYMLGKDIVND